jgi:hypothetical protein
MNVSLATLREVAKTGGESIMRRRYLSINNRYLQTYHMCPSKCVQCERSGNNCTRYLLLRIEGRQHVLSYSLYEFSLLHRKHRGWILWYTLHIDILPNIKIPKLYLTPL